LSIRHLMTTGSVARMPWKVVVRLLLDDLGPVSTQKAGS